MKAEDSNLEERAATWVTRHERGLTPLEQPEFAGWLAADPRHGQAFAAVQRSWNRLDRLRGSDEAERLEAELAELGPPVRHATAARRRRTWIPRAITAGAALACLALFAWLPPRTPDQGPLQVAATDTGGMRELALPDGSTVRMNTNTRLQVMFTAAERRVQLDRGEAMFTVAKNPDRPFVVRADGVDVRAVGTAFNVRLHAAAVEVTVSEGRVRVDDAANGDSLLALAETRGRESATQVMDAGHRVLIPTGRERRNPDRAPPVAVADAEIERALAWREGRLVFDSVALSTIAAEFNRYNQRQLVVADPELAARRFGGTFQANDPATFVELLEGSYDVVAETHPDRTVLRPRR